MPETLVLAELTIESSGVVTGFRESTNAIAGFDKKLTDLSGSTTRTSNVFAARMLNMRSAAQAFLGGFTIAGAVFALKNFAEAAIRANADFGKFTSTFSKFNADLLAVIGNLPGISQGMNDTAAGLERMDRVLVRMRASEATPGGQRAGVIVSTLFGSTPIGGLLNNLRLVGAAIDALFPASATGGGTLGPPGQARPWEFVGLLDVPAAPGAKRPGSAGGGAGAAGGSSILQDMWEENIDLSDKMNESLEKRSEIIFSEGWREVGGLMFPVLDPDAIERWEASLELSDRQNEAWENVPLPQLSAYESNVRSLSDALDQISIGFDTAMVASQAFGNALAQAAVDGSLNARKMLGEIIQAIGRAIIAYGVLIMAESYFTKDVAGFFKGVGFVVLGAATVGIGAKISSEGGGSASAEGGAAAAAGVSGGGGSREQNVYVYNYGTMIGGSPNELARAFKKLLRTAEADGAI